MINSWSRVRLEKKTVLHLVKILPNFYRTGMFITVFTCPYLNQLNLVHVSHPVSLRQF